MRLNEVKEVINQLYEFNINNKKEFNLVPMLVGETGIGKTSIVREIAKDKNIDCHIVRIGQFDEPAQLLGYPFIAIDIKKDNKTKTIKESVLHVYQNLGWEICSDPYTKYAKPDWVENIKDGDILLFDDYSRQLSIFNNALMDLIYERKNMGFTLPNCMIILTANPSNGEYQVVELDEAQKRRLIEIPINFDKKVWKSWAIKEGINPSFISFIMTNNIDKINNKDVVSYPIAKWTELFYFLNNKNINEYKHIIKLMVPEQAILFMEDVNNDGLYYDPENFFKNEPLKDLIHDYNEFVNSMFQDRKEKVKLISMFKLLEYIDNKIELGYELEIKDRIVEIYNAKNFLSEDFLYNLSQTIYSHNISNDLINRTAYTIL